MTVVASKVFATTVGGMENRLAQFTKAAERLVQQAGQIQAAEVKVATLDGKLTQMPEQLKAISDELRVHTAEKNKAKDEALKNASDVVVDMTAGIQTMRHDLNSVRRSTVRRQWWRQEVTH